MMIRKPPRHTQRPTEGLQRTPFSWFLSSDFLGLHTATRCSAPLGKLTRPVRKAVVVPAVRRRGAPHVERRGFIRPSAGRLSVFDLFKVEVALDHTSNLIQEIQKDVVARTVPSGPPHHLPPTRPQVIGHRSKRFPRRHLIGVVMDPDRLPHDRDPVMITIATHPNRLVAYSIGSAET